MSRINPPRKREQVAGCYQVGIFIRTPKGSVIECATNDATQAEADRAAKLLVDMSKAKPKRKAGEP